MQGHARKRGNKWAVVYDERRDEGGKRKQRWKSGFETKREAEAWLAKTLGSLNDNAYIEPSKQLLADFLEEWLLSLRASMRPSSLSAYEMLVRKHIVPAIGVTPLQKVTTRQLNLLYADMLESGRRDGKGGLSARTVRYAHATIRKALAYAVKDGRLPRNLAEFASPPKQHTRTQPNTWAAGELRVFLDGVATDRLSALYHLAATTGMRRGELCGLRWRDLDLDGGRLSISQTVVSVDWKVQFSRPKNDKGRSVALDGTTVLALREHRKRQLEERLALGGYEDDQGLVFCGVTGGPLHPGEVSKRFERLVRASGLPRIRFHDLRHTHATIALQAGVHPKVVSERLGHSDIAITLNTYSHAIPAMEEAAAEKVAALVFG